MDSAINPASTGTITPIARPPAYLKNAESGVMEPKLAPPVAPYPQSVSIRNARAVRIPPPITNGSMCDTPFIRCLYILLPTLPFALLDSFLPPSS